MDIRNVDLNLLVSFDALITERSVTRAAERQGVSQPAMSAALARLRDLFKDPLLLRSAHGMVPTPRAQALAEPVRRVLSEIDSVLRSPGDFNPETSSRTFRLQGTDYVEAVLLPLLVNRVREVAPDVKLHYRPPHPTQLAEDLERGDLDVGIGYIPSPTPDLRTRLVFRDRFVCVARRDHPVVRGTITLAHFAELAHLQVLPRDSVMYATPLDDALSALNIVRHIALWEPSFLNAPYLVSTSDLVTTIPATVASRFQGMLPIQVLPPPIELPEIEVRMFWANRAMNDSGHRWLRDAILEVGATLG